MNPLDACKTWVEQVVIGHNFCPFAKQEFDRGRVHFVLSENEGHEESLQALIRECERLDDSDEIETTLIVYATLLTDFEDFLDFVELANQLISIQGYEGVYQLANFHPDYCFEGEDENDASNYTNRSPFPMLHLIRENSLDKAVANYPSPERIPENNMKLAREKGQDYFKKLLNTMKNK